MQSKRSSLIKALSFTNIADKSSPISKEYKSKTLGSVNYAFQQGDKLAMAVYFENILLPKHVTHSFYATWVRCYEELFDASLSGKCSYIKFESNVNTIRKDTEKLSLEKASMCGISLDSDLDGKYTQTELMSCEEEEVAEVGQQEKEAGNFTPTSNLSEFQSSRASYSPGKLFNSKKGSYRLSYEL